MSSNIKFKRKIYRIPQEQKTWTGEDDLFAIQLMGESNVRDVDSGVISKSWRMFNYGWEYSLIGEVCKWAGDTEGGMLILGGRRTTLENYLRLWRKAIKEAGTWEEFLKDFFIREGHIEYPEKTEKKMDEYDKGFSEKYIKEMEIDGAWQRSDYQFYEEPRIKWVITLNTLEDLKKWLRASSLENYKKGVWISLFLKK